MSGSQLLPASGTMPRSPALDPAGTREQTVGSGRPARMDAFPLGYGRG